MAKARSKPKTGRQYNVRPDTLDFRDLMYEATLVEVPTRIIARASHTITAVEGGLDEPR